MTEPNPHVIAENVTTLPIRVVIADDHRVVRDSLQRVLNSQPDMTCIGEASDGAQALDLVCSLKPDVAIIDINMPQVDGIEITRQIKARCPEVSVLILTAYDYEEYLKLCIEAGAAGYVLKANMPCDGLVNAVRMVHSGSGVIDKSAMASLRKMLTTRRRIPGRSSNELCDRETEVLRLASTGATSRQIAESLHVSELTVNGYFTGIFRKLGVQSRIEAVMVGVKKGLIPSVDFPKTKP